LKREKFKESRRNRPQMKIDFSFNRKNSVCIRVYL
jgi:hypothetical protein